MLRPAAEGPAPCLCDADRELNEQDYHRLLKAARDAHKERLLMVLQTLASTGIRVSELQFITVEAIHRGHATVHCKGKCREIFLPEGLCRKLENGAGPRAGQVAPCL